MMDRMSYGTIVVDEPSRSRNYAMLGQITDLTVDCQIAFVVIRTLLKPPKARNGEFLRRYLAPIAAISDPSRAQIHAVGKDGGPIHSYSVF